MLNLIRLTSKPRWAKVMPLALVIILIGGCARSRFHKRLNRVGINITKAELKQIMESEGKAMGSEVQADGRILEVWDHTCEDFLSGEEEIFRFYFVDGRLVKWGAAGSRPAKRTMWLKPKVSASSNINANIGR